MVQFHLFRLHEYQYVTLHGYVLYGPLTAHTTVAMPIIWFLYPEVSGRTLEEVNLLFTSDSPLVSSNMKEFHRRIDEAGGNFAVAERRLIDEVDAAAGETDLRTASIVREEKLHSPASEHVDAKY